MSTRYAIVCTQERKERRLRDGAADAGSVGGALNDYPCPGKAMNVWLKLSSVKKALNIQPNNRFNSADNGVGMNYSITEPNLLPFYQHVMQKTDLRVLVYVELGDWCGT